LHFSRLGAVRGRLTGTKISLPFVMRFWYAEAATVALWIDLRARIFRGESARHALRQKKLATKNLAIVSRVRYNATHFIKSFEAGADMSVTYPASSARLGGAVRGVIVGLALALSLCPAWEA